MCLGNILVMYGYIICTYIYIYYVYICLIFVLLLVRNPKTRGFWTDGKFGLPASLRPSPVANCSSWFRWNALVKHQLIPLDKGSKEELRLGGGFEYFFIFNPYLGIFQMGLKPPTWRITLPETNSSHLKIDALHLNAVHVTARFGAVKTAVGWV